MEPNDPAELLRRPWDWATTPQASTGAEPAGLDSLDHGLGITRQTGVITRALAAVALTKRSRVAQTASTLASWPTDAFAKTN